MRREFSPKTKLQAFERCAGICEGKDCGAQLRPGRWECDHIIPCEFDGDNSIDNAQCLCEACHTEKTGKKDIPAIAKSNRIQRRAAGIRKPSTFPGGRNSPWKKRIDGTVVPR